MFVHPPLAVAAKADQSSFILGLASHRSTNRARTIGPRVTIRGLQLLTVLHLVPVLACSTFPATLGRVLSHANTSLVVQVLLSTSQ